MLIVLRNVLTSKNQTTENSKDLNNTRSQAVGTSTIMFSFAGPLTLETLHERIILWNFYFLLSQETDEEPAAQVEYHLGLCAA